MFKSLGDNFEHDRNYYRIYIPLGSQEKKEFISDTQKEIINFLNQNGYEVLDYVKGITKYGDAKNTTTIGKVLTRLKDDDLMKKFVSDESRKALTSDVENLMVVISRHPYDIVGSDTDRNWTNCMTLGHPESQRTKELVQKYNELKKVGGDKEKLKDLKDKIESRKETGENTKYLLNDIKEGSLISYLIKKDDKNINNPLAVLNIKPYVNEKNNADIILLSDNKMYGNARPEFKKTVDNVLEVLNGDKHGSYCINKYIYKDDGDREVIYYSTEDLYNQFKEIINSITNVEKTNCYSKDDLYKYKSNYDSEFYQSKLEEKCFLLKNNKNQKIAILRVNFLPNIYGAEEKENEITWYKYPKGLVKSDFGGLRTNYVYEKVYSMLNNGNLSDLINPKIKSVIDSNGGKNLDITFNQFRYDR